MKHTDGRKGFSLVELMIVVAVVAILVALALPSYTRYVLKANRGEAQQLLLNWANNQEIWRANDSNYATSAEITPPSHTKYDFFVRATASNPPAIGDCGHTAPSATNYALVACAKLNQVNDTERDLPCSVLTIDQSNEKLRAECW